MPLETPSIQAVRCDSRYISRCARALANAYCNKESSLTSWITVYNRAVEVLTEERAEAIAGESRRSVVYDFSIACLAVVLTFGACKLGGCQ